MQGCSWSWGVIGLVFAGYVLLASQSPYPIIFYSILWPIIDHMLTTFGQICYFRDPNLVTFYFYELTHFLDWMKNTLLFICSTNILVCLLTINMKNCLTKKNPKMSVPILVTLLKMRPHYSQSRHENVTPSSGTSPLASYKEVPCPPQLMVIIVAICCIVVQFVYEYASAGQTLNHPLPVRNYC